MLSNLEQLIRHGSGEEFAAASVSTDPHSWTDLSPHYPKEWAPLFRHTYVVDGIVCVCVCWVDHVANSVLICRGGYQSSETQLSFQLGTKTKFAHNLTFVLSREIDNIYTRANTCPF